MRLEYGLFLTTLCALASGCFVDLDRDTAILSLVVARTDSRARAVRVSLDETEDIEPFSATFALPDAPQGQQRLRDITAPPGLIALTAETIDASATVLQRLDDNLRLLPGVNVIRLDFGDGSGGGVPETERSEIIMAETTVRTSTGGSTFVVTVPVDRERFQTAITRITEALMTTPTVLTLRSVDVVVQELDGMPHEFDDLWRGEITIRINGGNVALSLPTFVPVDEQTNYTSERRVDVSDWLSPPSDTQVTIRGTPAIGGPDLPVTVSVRLNLAGSEG